MVINHFPESTSEDKIKAFLQIYERIVIGGKYYEREEQSEMCRSRRKAKGNEKTEKGQH
jgi:hypothetical protein